MLCCPACAVFKILGSVLVDIKIDFEVDVDKGVVVVGIIYLTIRSSAPLVIKKLRSELGSRDRERIGWRCDLDTYIGFHCGGDEGDGGVEEKGDVKEKTHTDPSSYPDITVKHLVTGWKNNDRHIIMPGLSGPGEGILWRRWRVGIWKMSI